MDAETTTSTTHDTKAQELTRFVSLPPVSGGRASKDGGAGSPLATAATSCTESEGSSFRQHHPINRKRKSVTFIDSSFCGGDPPPLSRHGSDVSILSNMSQTAPPGSHPSMRVRERNGSVVSTTVGRGLRKVVCLTRSSSQHSNFASRHNSRVSSNNSGGKSIASSGDNSGGMDSVDPFAKQIQEDTQHMPGFMAESATDLPQTAAVRKGTTATLKASRGSAFGGSAASYDGVAIAASQGHFIPDVNAEEDVPMEVLEEVITEAEYRNMKKAFDSFDENKNGSIDGTELQQLLKSIGLNLGVDQTDNLIAEVTESTTQRELYFPDFVKFILFWKDAARFRLLELIGDLHTDHINSALRTGVIISDAKWKFFWDAVVLGCILYLTCMTTYLYTVFSRFDEVDRDSAFSADTTVGTIASEALVSLLMLIDLVICSQTAVVAGRRLIVDRKEVMLHYLHTYFVVDLLATVPMWLFVSDYTALFVLPLRLLKCIKTKTLWCQTGWSQMDPMYVTLHFQVRLIIEGIASFIFLVHNGAVITMYIDPRISYSTGVYYVMYMISGVGFGDTPLTTDTMGKQWYAMFLMVVSMCINGYVVGGIVTHFQVTDVSQERRMKLRETAAICDYFEIPSSLANEILMFQDHVLRNNLSTVYFNLVSGLPAEMRLHIGIYSRMSIIENHPLFSSAHRGVLISLAQLLEACIYCPEEFVVLAESEASEMFFVAFGFLDVMSKRGIYIKTIMTGDHFGEATLFNATKHVVSVKSLTYCDLFVLHRDRFATISNRFHNFRNIVNKEVQRYTKKRASVAMTADQQAAAAAAAAKHFEEKKKAGVDPSLSESRELSGNSRLNRSPVASPTQVEDSFTPSTLVPAVRARSRSVAFAFDLHQFESASDATKAAATDLLLFGGDTELESVGDTDSESQATPRNPSSPKGASSARFGSPNPTLSNSNSSAMIPQKKSSPTAESAPALLPPVPALDAIGPSAAVPSPTAPTNTSNAAMKRSDSDFSGGSSTVRSLTINTKPSDLGPAPTVLSWRSEEATSVIAQHAMMGSTSSPQSTTSREISTESEAQPGHPHAVPELSISAPGVADGRESFSFTKRSSWASKESVSSVAFMQQPMPTIQLPDSGQHLSVGGGGRASFMSSASSSNAPPSDGLHTPTPSEVLRHKRRTNDMDTLTRLLAPDSGASSMSKSNSFLLATSPRHSRSHSRNSHLSTNRTSFLSEGGSIFEQGEYEVAGPMANAHGKKIQRSSFFTDVPQPVENQDHFPHPRVVPPGASSSQSNSFVGGLLGTPNPLHPPTREPTQAPGSDHTDSPPSISLAAPPAAATLGGEPMQPPQTNSYGSFSQNELSIESTGGGSTTMHVQRGEQAAITVTLNRPQSMSSVPGSATGSSGGGSGGSGVPITTAGGGGGGGANTNPLSQQFVSGSNIPEVVSNNVSANGSQTDVHAALGMSNPLVRGGGGGAEANILSMPRNSLFSSVGGSGTNLMAGIASTTSSRNSYTGTGNNTTTTTTASSPHAAVQPAITQEGSSSVFDQQGAQSQSNNSIPHSPLIDPTELFAYIAQIEEEMRSMSMMLAAFDGNAPPLPIAHGGGGGAEDSPRSTASGGTPGQRDVSISQDEVLPFDTSSGGAFGGN